VVRAGPQFTGRTAPLRPRPPGFATPGFSSALRAPTGRGPDGAAELVSELAGQARETAETTGWTYAACWGLAKYPRRRSISAYAVEGVSGVSVTTSEAARRLGVSANEVRRLLAAGDLKAVSVGRIFLVDEASVRTRLRAPKGRGRALAPQIAWAALLEASGERALWLDRSTRSRLRRWLRGHDPDAIAAGCRRRAVRVDLRVLPTYRGAVMSTQGVVAGGMSARDQVDSGIVAVGDVAEEMYCSKETLDKLSRDYGLSQLGAANLIVRVPTFDDDQVLTRRVMPRAVVAVDLLESDDVRTRRLGAQILTRAVADQDR